MGGSLGDKAYCSLLYKLRGLPMACNVLHIGAHPDDEDAGLIPYLSRKFGVRVVYWSATRGEGGQNRIGPYRDEALGVYRTWESLAARDVDGGKCLFGPFIDFGYSKNAEDTFSRWGKQALIREIVRAIRFVQAQIVVCRWTGGEDDLHGQHQAVGAATLQAFDAAGDPSSFPELKLEGLAPWQPLKLYHSMNNSGGDLTFGGALNLTGRYNPAFEKKGILRINTGEFDPIAGTTYQEQAWMAYNSHKTQGMGLAPCPGDFFYYYKLSRTTVDVPNKETSFFDGFDPTMSGLCTYYYKGHPSPVNNTLVEVKHKAAEALDAFMSKDPETASSLLLSCASLLETARQKLIEESGIESSAALARYLGGEKKAFESSVAGVLGLKLECLCERPRVVPGHKVAVTARLWNQTGVRLRGIKFYPLVPAGWDAQVSEPLCTYPTLAMQEFQLEVGKQAAFTTPYWLSEPRDRYLYRRPKGNFHGEPLGPWPAQMKCEVQMEQGRIALEVPIVCREAFLGGFRELPLAVIPPVSIHCEKKRIFLRKIHSAHTLDFQVIARNNSDRPIHGNLELIAPAGWTIEPKRTQVSMQKFGESQTFRHKVNTPEKLMVGRSGLRYVVQTEERDYSITVESVRQGPPGLSRLPDESNCLKEALIFSPAEVHVHVIDAKFVEGLRYAYVKGMEEGVAEALEGFGAKFHMLADQDIGYLALEQFDAVVIGPNAYVLRESLRSYATRFLEYVREGGILVVQYQGYPFENRGLAPYPFAYNHPHDRITNENAPVEILDKDHVLFRLPNRITKSDFDGWIRDRGLYFFGQWDKRYKALLKCSDPGEEPKLGGMLECQYGKGTFLYCGYSLFRQMSAGVSGAFRLFANILALPHARILERIEFLKNISLFSPLTEEQLDAVARIILERWVDSGEYICRQEEKGDELYIIYKGEVEVLINDGAEDRLIRIAGKGECLGELAVFGEMGRTASLRAKGDVLLLVIRGDHFQRILRQNPDMAIEMIKILVAKLPDYVK